jgi:hypothetical protein
MTAAKIGNEENEVKVSTEEEKEAAVSNEEEKEESDANMNPGSPLPNSMPNRYGCNRTPSQSTARQGQDDKEIT